MHKVTFVPQNSKQSGQTIEKEFTLKDRSHSTVYMDKDGNKVPKAIVEEILAAQKDLEAEEEKSKDTDKNPSSAIEELDEDLETITMTTRHNEKFVCTLPKTRMGHNIDLDSKHSGQTPLDYLEPLLLQQPCTHRLDHYWTYELCHGKILRQYHEERDGSKVKKTEYILGTYDKALFGSE